MTLLAGIVFTALGIIYPIMVLVKSKEEPYATTPRLFLALLFAMAGYFLISLEVSK